MRTKVNNMEVLKYMGVITLGCKFKRYKEYSQKYRRKSKAQALLKELIHSTKATGFPECLNFTQTAPYSAGTIFALA